MEGQPVEEVVRLADAIGGTGSNLLLEFFSAVVAHSQVIQVLLRSLLLVPTGSGPYGAARHAVSRAVVVPFLTRGEIPLLQVSNTLHALVPLHAAFHGVSDFILRHPAGNHVGIDGLVCLPVIDAGVVEDVVEVLGVSLVAHVQQGFVDAVLHQVVVRLDGCRSDARLDVPLEVRHRDAQQPGDLRKQICRRASHGILALPREGFFHVGSRLQNLADRLHIHPGHVIPLHNGDQVLEVGDVASRVEVRLQVAVPKTIPIVQGRLLLAGEAGICRQEFFPIVPFLIVVPQRVHDGLHDRVYRKGYHQRSGGPCKSAFGIAPAILSCCVAQIVDRIHEHIVGLGRLCHKGGRHFRKSIRGTHDLRPLEKSVHHLRLVHDFGEPRSNSLVERLRAGL